MGIICKVFGIWCSVASTFTAPPTVEYDVEIWARPLQADPGKAIEDAVDRATAIYDLLLSPEYLAGCETVAPAVIVRVVSGSYIVNRPMHLRMHRPITLSFESGSMIVVESITISGRVDFYGNSFNLSAADLSSDGWMKWCPESPWCTSQ